MAFAVSSPDHWWLGWITLLPVFQAIRTLTPLRAALGCGLWGASLFAFCVGLFETAIPGTPGAFAALTLVPAAYGFVGARVTRRVGFSPYLLALGWMGVELALDPVGLRHGLLAATQGNGLLLGAFGSFTGFVLVAFVVAYVNASLLSALHTVHRAIAQSRMAVRGSDVCKPLAFEEAFFYLIHLICRAQPRAPPAR
jgi:apolipoprotein N-acyltransferase